jgi:predicted nucleic acid-binding protein
MSELEETQKRCFIDTNIWLYAFVETDDEQKSVAAKSVIQKPDVVVSIQVINEVCVNMLRKASLPEKDIQALIIAFYEKYTVTDIDRVTLLKASELREKYSLSYWDSLIVANALNADCAILYSEDMQDGLQVEQKLTVINPVK